MHGILLSDIRRWSHKMQYLALSAVILGDLKKLENTTAVHTVIPESLWDRNKEGVEWNEVRCQKHLKQSGPWLKWEAVKSMWLS